MTLEAFGSNLKRMRQQRGISLAQIARSTKVAEDLLAGLERNDFSQWPSGIYARAWVRQYASAIGADAELTIDEFCRWFPQGDRRAAPLMLELSALYDHRSEWREDDEHQRRFTDRPDRQQAQPASQSSSFFSRLRRILLAAR